MQEDPSVLLRKIGRLIRQRRQALDMTQKELADRLGITSSNITIIEQGEQNLTIRTLSKLADALGVSVMELLGAELAGVTPEEELRSPTEPPLADVLSSLAVDARALAELARSTREEDREALAPSLDAFAHRIAAVAEGIHRPREVKQDERESADDAPPSPPARPGPRAKARRRGR